MRYFANAKEAFIQNEGIVDFIALDVNIKIQEKLKDYILYKPFQIVLLTGEPGAGKTYTAQKVASDIGKDKCYFQKYPFSTTVGFLSTLHRHFLPGVKLQEPCTREILIDSFRVHCTNKFAPVIIIDEIQLYKNDELEIIRMLSDTRIFRFVFILHKLEHQNLLAQNYFVSRTWGNIELMGLSLQECELFISQKLHIHNLASLKQWFGRKQYVLLHKLTKGNLRMLCKLCYTLFEICEYYEERVPSLFAGHQIPAQCIEMAAIDLGVLHE